MCKVVCAVLSLVSIMIILFEINMCILIIWKDCLKKLLISENSTTEDTSQTSSLIGNCQSRLGQDLLRMFLEEIAPDVIVEVSGRRIKAHKCILSSR